MLWGSTCKVAKRNAPHAHDMHELVVCLSRTGRHEVDGCVYEFWPGRTVFLPAGVSHYVEGSAAEPATIAFVCFDDFSCLDREPRLPQVVRRFAQERLYATPFDAGWCEGTLALSARLQSEFEAVRPFAPSMAGALLTALLVQHCRGMGIGDRLAPGGHAVRIAQACEWVAAHHDQDIRLDAMARRAGMSRTLFAQKFRAYTGMTLIEFVMAARTDAAMKLLAGTDGKVLDIALRCGFGNLGHFHRTFKRLCSMTPAAYRRVAGARGTFVRKLRLLARPGPV